MSLLSASGALSSTALSFSRLRTQASQKHLMRPWRLSKLPVNPRKPHHAHAQARLKTRSSPTPEKIPGPRFATSRSPAWSLRSESWDAKPCQRRPATLSDCLINGPRTLSIVSRVAVRLVLILTTNALTSPPHRFIAGLPKCLPKRHQRTMLPSCWAAGVLPPFPKTRSRCSRRRAHGRLT